MIHTSQQARKLLLSLVCIQLLLVVIYGTDAWVHGPTERLDDVIDLDGEGNLPTWFSSFQLALIAISFWALASRVRETGRPSRRFLKTCGGAFLLLSIDETAMFHERITASVGSRYIDWMPAYLTAHIGNTVVCAFVALACIAGAYPHLRGLWMLSRRATLIGLAGCVFYLTGGGLLETIGYKMLSAGVSLSLYRVEVALEEFFEMLGASLILYAVLLFCCLVADKRRSQRHTLTEVVSVREGMRNLYGRPSVGAPPLSERRDQTKEGRPYRFLIPSRDYQTVGPAKPSATEWRLLKWKR